MPRNKHLTFDEERAALRKAQRANQARERLKTCKCDKHRLKLQEEIAAGQEARDLLVTRNLGFVHQCARRRAPFFKQHDPDDLIHFGVIGLLRAIDKFDLTQPVRFMTYAGWCIDRSIYREAFVSAQVIRNPANRRQVRVKCLNMLDENVDGDYRSYFAAIGSMDDDAADIGETTDAIARLRATIRKLPQPMRAVLTAKLKGRTLTDIGDRAGLTRQRIGQIAIRGIKLLRTLMNPEVSS